MNLLIIGGSVFVGRALTEEALSRGWSVTHFNRGKSSPSPLPGVETVIGDRFYNLDRLAGREFDAVIDTCGYTPRAVNISSCFFAQHTRIYAFVSSISVYAPPPLRGTDENGRLQRLENPHIEEVTPHTYGPLKAVCEEMVRESFPGNHLILRPGFIFGPGDPTDRLAYWITRMRAHRPFIIPDVPDMPVQLIDVRDMASWTISAIEARRNGVFNLTGPASPITFSDFFAALQEATGCEGEDGVRVPPERLLEHNVRPFIDIPLWLPTESFGMARVSIKRALRAGLKMRPLAETMRAVQEWIDATGRTPKYGIEPEAEAELLANLD